MKRVLPAIFLLAVLLQFSCSGKNNKKQEEPEDNPTEKTVSADAEKGNKTPQHVKVPETNLYIIPPPGFTENKVAMQLSKEYANFMRMRFLSGYTVDNFFSGLKAQADIDFPGSWKEEKLTVQGHPVSIFTYVTAGFIQYYLVFPDHFSEDMILATVEIQDSTTRKQMYDALKTVVVEK